MISKIHRVFYTQQSQILGEKGMESGGPDMERRALERMPAGKDVRISYRKNIYSGTVLNLSEKGMFIGTSECFPPDSIIRIENELLNILVKVNWVTEMNGYYDGIGVEVINKKEN